MIELAFVGVGIAFALAGYAVLAQVQDRAVMRSSLRSLEGIEVDNVRDRELLNPLRDRAIAPLLSGLTGLGRRFTPVGYVEQVRAKFVRMGKADPDEVDRFLAVRVITVALVPVMAALVWFASPVGGMLRLALLGLVTMALVMGPDAILNRKVEERQYAIRVALPDILDLLVISVEAGLGFEQALDRTVKSVPGPLSDEFARMLGETRAGSTRAQAMRALERRVDIPELRSFVLAVLQADTFGVSIGRVLRAQADEMRIKRRQLAQERAMKAPVKMLVPMVFCIFPSLFVITLGPAMLNIMNSL